ncbi:hypothetical protein V5F77_27525 [Xanthobacter sp. DSM 24535]|uniref:hypothetical protein n=1 Tax=Roseixanthobacter psychrophilus TaxID=3119917 RepID=UPI00372AE217
MLAGIFAFLLRLLSGGLLDKVLGALRARADTELAHERLRTDITISAVQAEVESRRVAGDIVIAEQGWWVTAMIRPLFVYPLLAWWWLVILDSIFLFRWNIAALPKPLDEWAGWIVAAYFVTRPFEKIAEGLMRRRA